MENTLTGVIAFLKKYADFDSETVTADSQLIADLGIDSLTLIAVADAAEQEFGIYIEDEEIASIKTVGDIAAVLDKQQKE